MSNELTIEKDYGVIVLHDKSTIFFPEEAYNSIVNAYTNPLTQIIDLRRYKKGIHSKSGIKDILTLDEYYQQYPQARPERKFENQFEKYESLTDRVPIEGLPSLIQGLKKYIRNNEFDGIKKLKARALLERYEKRLARG